MIKKFIAKLKVVVSPKKSGAAEVHLTNGTIITSPNVKITALGGGGGGGNGRTHNGASCNPGMMEARKK
jgi:hypothetical protein